MAGITTIYGLKSRVMPDLPGCPVVTVEQAIQDTVRQFCIDSECWQVEVTQTLTAATVLYTMAPTQTEADMRRIVWVKTKTASTDETDQTPEVDPELYTFDGVNKLTFDSANEPVSTVTNGLVTKLVLTPKLDSITWDSGLMNRWDAAIVAGVKARLMDNEKESWGNPRRAEGFAKDYQRQVTAARVENERKYRTGSINAQGRSWL